MNKQVGTRDKKIALLLSAAFAWLFIGSLIIFHQEHVLGKHLQMNQHLFISPKKDKENYSLNLEHPLQKLQEDGQMPGIVLDSGIQTALLSFSVSAFSDAFAFMRLHDEVVTQAPLRAPPVSC